MRNSEKLCVLARCISADQPPYIMHNAKEDFCSPCALQWNKRMFCLQLRTVWPVTSCIPLYVFTHKTFMYWTHTFLSLKIYLYKPRFFIPIIFFFILLSIM